MTQIIVNSDHVLLQDFDSEDLDMFGDESISDSDNASGLLFDDLDQEGQRKVRKEIRRFKKGF